MFFSFRLTKVYHPDKNSSPEARVEWTKIQEAYEKLRNLDSRRKYDRETLSESRPSMYEPIKQRGYYNPRQDQFVGRTYEDIKKMPYHYERMSIRYPKMSKPPQARPYDPHERIQRVKKQKVWEERHEVQEKQQQTNITIMVMMLICFIILCSPNIGGDW